jgi:hypothetical protein
MSLISCVCSVVLSAMFDNEVDVSLFFFGSVTISEARGFGEK